MKKTWMLAIGWLLSLGVNAQELKYPYIDALDAEHWNGLVAVESPDKAFAMRFNHFLEISKGLRYIERGGWDFQQSVSDVGHKASDGLYAEVSWKVKGVPATLSWSRIDEETVVGKLKCGDTKGRKFGVWLEFYAPWLYESTYAFKDGKVSSPNSDFTVVTDLEPSHVLPMQFMDKSRYVENVLKGGKIKKEDASLLLAFQAQTELRFVLAKGDKKALLKDVDALLAKKKQELIARRAAKRNGNEEVYDAISNNINWMITYNPEQNYLYVPSGRTWVSNLWTMHEWDAFFNALSLSVESPKLAEQEVNAILNCMYEETGNVPNVRDALEGSEDRSQPPIGSYIVWRIYEQTKNKEWLAKVYPRLKKWRAYWTAKVETGHARRDGNDDGLLEWGSDAKYSYGHVTLKHRAQWESGMDDLPLWDEAKFIDETWTMNLNALDFNCLYALDAENMAFIANELGEKKDKSTFEKEYANTKRLINEKLWDESKGFYYDQFWDGKLSDRKAASNFYVLLAGIAPEDRAKRVLAHLTNEDEFWGDYVVPTISKDDKDYQDQQYWRGTIWPPTNYLVYKGLKRYKFEAIAKEYAEKSTALFMKHYRNGGGCPENFDSITGKFGGQRYQSWGVLYPLIMLEERLSE